MVSKQGGEQREKKTRGLEKPLGERSAEKETIEDLLNGDSPSNKWQNYKFKRGGETFPHQKPTLITGPTSGVSDPGNTSGPGGGRLG